MAPQPTNPFGIGTSPREQFINARRRTAAPAGPAVFTGKLPGAEVPFGLATDPARQFLTPQKPAAPGEAFTGLSTTGATDGPHKSAGSWLIDHSVGPVADWGNSIYGAAMGDINGPSTPAGQASAPAGVGGPAGVSGVAVPAHAPAQPAAKHGLTAQEQELRFIMQGGKADRSKSNGLAKLIAGAQEAQKQQMAGLQAASDQAQTDTGGWYKDAAAEIAAAGHNHEHIAHQLTGRFAHEAGSLASGSRGAGQDMLGREADFSTDALRATGGVQSDYFNRARVANAEQMIAARQSVRNGFEGQRRDLAASQAKDQLDWGIQAQQAEAQNNPVDDQLKRLEFAQKLNSYENGGDGQMTAPQKATIAQHEQDAYNKALEQLAASIVPARDVVAGYGASAQTDSGKQLYQLLQSYARDPKKLGQLRGNFAKAQG